MTLRQDLLKSLAAEGCHLRVVPKETASDWLIRVGPIVAQRNRESLNDPKGAE